MFANDGEDVAEVIASHYLEAYRAAADDPDAEILREQTLTALRRAGQRAATVGAPETASISTSPRPGWLATRTSESS